MISESRASGCAAGVSSTVQRCARPTDTRARAQTENPLLNHRCVGGHRHCNLPAVCSSSPSRVNTRSEPSMDSSMRRRARCARPLPLLFLCALLLCALPLLVLSSSDAPHPPPPQSAPTPSAGATTANTPGIPARSEVSIDAVTVLLPAHVAAKHRTFVVYHPVQAHGGCFTWRTSNPALVVVQPIAATACSERVSQRNAATGEAEWVTLQGHTSVYVSAAASLSSLVQPDEGGGTGPTAPGAPHTSNQSFQRRLQAWISAHDITKPDRFAEWSAFTQRSKCRREVGELPDVFLSPTFVFAVDCLCVACSVRFSSIASLAWRF